MNWRTTTAPLLIAAGLLVAAASPAQAQDRRRTWEYGMFAGLTQFGMDGISKDGVLVPNIKADTDFLTGIRAAYAVTNHWQAEMVWDLSVAPGEAPFDDMAFDFMSFQINAIYNFRREASAGVDPYLFAGYGIVRTEIEGSQFGQSNPPTPGRSLIDWLPFANDSGSVDDNSKLIVWGLGMRVFGTEEYGFRFELKRKSYDIFDSETDDDEFTFGVMWRLGKELARPEEEEVIPLD